MRIYLFVDAENHCHRSIAVAQKVIGSQMAPEALAKTKMDYWNGSAFPYHIDGNRFAWKPALQLFWDCSIFTRLDRREYKAPDRAVFVGSCTGGDDEQHNMRTGLRDLGFEPVV